MGIKERSVAADFSGNARSECVGAIFIVTYYFFSFFRILDYLSINKLIFLFG